MASDDEDNASEDEMEEEEEAELEVDPEGEQDESLEEDAESDSGSESDVSEDPEWEAKEEDLPEEGSDGSSEQEGDDSGGEGDVQDRPLQFEAGMDPLRLVNGEGDGDAYEQFARLQLQMQEQRKRKVSKSASDEPKKKKGRSNLYGASVDEIWGRDVIDSEISRQTGRRRRGRRRKRKNPLGGMPAEVNKKLGEANLLYALERYQEAVDLLVEVVRLSPNLPDSYHTLGLLHDAMGDRPKALQFYMIAAHLTPKDSSLWKRLAAWSMELNNSGQAIYCLTKVVRADPEDVDARWDRAVLYAEVGDIRKATEEFDRLHKLRPQDADVAKMLARMHHKLSQPAKAIKVLEALLEAQPAAELDLTALNILAELHMEQGSFQAAVDMMEKARGTGGNLPLDLSVKAGICHAYLDNITLAEAHFAELQLEGPEECADLFMDVGDMWKAVGHPQRALVFYRALRTLPAYDQPGLWLKVAQCHSALGEAASALEMYEAAVRSAPGHIPARLALAEAYRDSGRLEEAIDFLSGREAQEGQPKEGASSSSSSWEGHIQVKLLRARLLHAASRQQEYLSLMVPLLRQTLEAEQLASLERRKGGRKANTALKQAPVVGEGSIFGVYQPKDPRHRSIRNSQLRSKKRAEARAAAARERGELPSEDEAPPLGETGDDSAVVPDAAPTKPLPPPPLPGLFQEDAKFELLLQTCKTLAEAQQYRAAVELINRALEAGRSMTNEKKKQLKFLAVGLALNTKDQVAADESIRYVCRQRPYSNSAWNVFNRLLASGGSEKMRKFLLAFRLKHPDSVPLALACGHQFAVQNLHHTALREYLRAYQRQPQEPLINLCIGVALLHACMTRKVLQRNKGVLQAFSFMYQYYNLCKGSQEASYNMARAYHQLGLVHVAVPYYQRALEQAPGRLAGGLQGPTGDAAENPPLSRAGDGSQGAEVVDVQSLTLRREAAHNLALIYKASGAHDLARQTLEQHLVV